ncbi:MAG TPA: hypothetical protein VHL53_03585 [Acidimicrobiia bacterium]|nr:hypothetical protein [Acidimicrobiia bacterium]
MPERVAIRWRQAFENGDFETRWDLETTEKRGPVTQKASTIASEKNAYKPATPDHQVVAIKATRTVKATTDPKNRFVFVYLQVTERDYPPRQETVTLRKVGGAWRVAKWEP